MKSKPQLAVNLFGSTSPNTPKIADINVDSIIPNPDQPRKTFSEESLNELAESIKRHGLLQPITLKRNENDIEKYILVAGERRLRAHKLLGKDKIYSIVLTTGNIDELTLVENIQREDLNALEEAEALAKLMDKYHYTQEALGKVVGKVQATISNILNLNRLPEKIKQDYSTSNNRISKSLLMEVARHENKDEQMELWSAIKLGTMTVKSTRAAKKAKKDDVLTFTYRQTLLTGRLFVKRLEEIKNKNIDSTTVSELFLIKQEIDESISTLSSPEEQILNAIDIFNKTTEIALKEIKLDQETILNLSDLNNRLLIIKEIIKN
jgi:ParB family transcriptional regulator, chromosome partitioning protein